MSGKDSLSKFPSVPGDAKITLKNTDKNELFSGFE
jgi:hypothetical protein